MAIPLLRKALAIYERLYGQDHPLWYGTANNLGWILSEEKKFDEAQMLVERSIAVAKKVFGAESPDVATALNTYGNLLSDRGGKREAIVQYERAAAMWQRTLGDTIGNVLSWMDKHDGDVVDALYGKGARDKRDKLAK